MGPDARHLPNPDWSSRFTLLAGMKNPYCEHQMSDRIHTILASIAMAAMYGIMTYTAFFN